jgi:hypothetical protein
VLDAKRTCEDSSTRENRGPRRSARLSQSFARRLRRTSSREENLAAPITGEEKAVLTDAPNVPPPITRDLRAEGRADDQQRCERSGRS